MADYWVSRDKYFCKYCKIYIADDKPSRLGHETGMKHKGNYERYIHGIYKKGITEKREAKEEKIEMARIEAAAAAAMGLAPPEETPDAPPAGKKPTASKTSSDPFANYTTAANLGITDEDATKAKEEAEARQKEGTIGQWERVVRMPKPAPPPVPTGGFAPSGGAKKEEDGEDVKPGQAAVSASLGLGQEDAENPVEAAKKRGFLTERSALPFDDDEDDPLASLGPIKIKKRRLTVKEQQQIDDEAAEKLRAREEAQEAAKRRGAQGTGWEAANVEDDEEFDPLAGLGVPEQVEEAEGEFEKKPEVEEEKPKVASGFKKRKMHGAGSVRKTK